MESSQNPSRHHATGPQYGNYVVLQDAEGHLRELGRGSFGITYLSRHTSQKSLAALKVIHNRFSTDPVVRERFLRERHALARLDHPHIARLIDSGEVRGELFHVAEYCAGGDLARRVDKEGSLPLEEWLQVARQLASALDYCHRAGFIHRDLKPSNVLLADTQRPLVVKLVDFGLVDGGRTAKESASPAIGTPVYASPEQLRGETVDARSDLFSLGMTLWHLAEGRPAETGTPAQVISRRLSAENLTDRIPRWLPSELRKLVARLVEKKKEDRPASAAEVLAALGEPRDHGSVPTRLAESRRSQSRRVAVPPPSDGETQGRGLPSDLLSEDVLSSLDTHIGPPPKVEPSRRLTEVSPRPSVWLVLLLIACLAAGGAYYWSLYHQSSDIVAKIPAHAFLQVAGEIPSRAVWTVAGTPVTLVSKEEHAEVPLPAGRPLPVEIVATAAGYKAFHVTLASLGNLREPVETSFERSKGTLAIVRHGPCDYGNVAVQMTNTLDSETDSVPVSRVTLSKSLQPTPETVRWELPTGVYQLSLVGLRNSVNTRPFQEITIREGKEETCQLPATFAGRYAGKLTSTDAQPGPGGEAPAELTLYETLTEGELRYKAHFVLEHVRVSSKGVLTATAKADLQRADTVDLLLTVQLSADGQQLETKLTDIFDPDRKAKPAASTGGERVETGTLLRISSSQK